QTISTRALNEVAVFGADKVNLQVWGKGPVQMEGVGVRFTITSPAYDTLVIRPLGPDGRPAGQPIGVGRRSGGRFTTLINTADHATPWYRLEFGSTTSVDEEGSRPMLTLLNNPATDGRAVIWLRERCEGVHVVDVNGRVLASANGVEGSFAFDVAHLAAGYYRVVARSITGSVTSEPLVIQ
ncbi:MAG TPA: hypothetical protein DCZ59_00410, partial [Bacteroidetes bacterium]|nr:hypothetical protein [Bacteroidota bacterium]